MHESASDIEVMRAAFRDVHGVRLHGFAVVLVLGDRHAAARLTAEAFAAVADQAPRLRHPERAAAALRTEVVRRARHLGAPGLDDARRATLAHLGIDGPTAAALARLNMTERATLLAAQIEGFTDQDVAVILRTTPARARRAATAARRRYMDHHPGDGATQLPGPGPIGERVGRVAAQALGASAS